MTYIKDYTIIIKFTQNDNICATNQEFGWVDYFAKILTASVNYQLDATINVVYKNETEIITAEDFNASDLILYVLSPAFIFSSNINKDAEVLETAFNFDIPFINKKVKKVFKAPVKVEELPLSLSTPTYYRFYDYNEENSNEYSTFEGWNTYQENIGFWKVFSDVLNDTIKSFLNEKDTAIKNVYISNNSDRYFHIRNDLKRELNAQGIKIFPDEDFSIEANYMEDPELFFMDRCDLSIHYPEDFINLTTEERNRAFNKLPEHTRYIWFDPMENIVPEKKAQYSELKVQLKPYKNIEAIETPIEEFKEIIKTIVFKEKEDLEDLEDNRETVYVISDTLFTDDEKLNLENNSLVQSKYKLKILSNVENVADYRLMHYKLLKHADHFLIIHLKENSDWLKTMVSEVKKAPGFNREHSIKGKYIGMPKTINRSDKILADFKVIDISSIAALEDKLIEIL
ncbi:MAG: hypothetical protein ACI9XJ_001310 [Marivirga sp.]